MLRNKMQARKWNLQYDFKNTLKKWPKTDIRGCQDYACFYIFSKLPTMHL